MTISPPGRTSRPGWTWLFRRAVRAGTEAVHARRPVGAGRPRGHAAAGLGRLRLHASGRRGGRDGVLQRRRQHRDRARLQPCPGGADHFVRPGAGGRAGLSGAPCCWAAAGWWCGTKATWSRRTARPARAAVPRRAAARTARGGIAARLIAATPVIDPVAILVSPPSFRVHWLLERRADGIAWEKRDSETEGGHATADRRALSRTVQLLTGLGVRPLFVSPTMLAGGGLRTAGMRMLVLPQSIALSDAEAAAIRDFIAGGGGCWGWRGRPVRRPRPAPGKPGLGRTCRPSPGRSAMAPAAGIRPA